MIAVLLAVATASLAQAGEVPKPDAEAFIARCGSRKFETTVNSNNKGKLRRAKILLCAKPDESDEQWIATLQKAAAQLEASPELSADAKSKVVAEIQGAISDVRSAINARALTGASSGAQAAIAPIAPVLTPPPMPPLAPLVSNVPPLPRSPTVAPVRAIAIPVAKPRISISCPPPGEPGMASPCSDLASDSLLMIRADEDLKTTVSLRFIRDGDPRGGIALGAMRRGQVVRARLPSKVCSGVVRGRVELQTVVIDPQTRVEQVADRQGPYLLRC